MLAASSRYGVLCALFLVARPGAGLDEGYRRAGEAMLPPAGRPLASELAACAHDRLHRAQNCSNRAAFVDGRLAAGFAADADHHYVLWLKRAVAAAPARCGNVSVCGTLDDGASAASCGAPDARARAARQYGGCFVSSVMRGASDYVVRARARGRDRLTRARFSPV